MSSFSILSALSAINILITLVMVTTTGNLRITSNTALAETSPINTPVNITNWQGCHEDEVTVMITSDPPE
jgi:hypothetical protein